MSAIEEQTGRLHALHDEYIWRVNAAIAAGRPELARELADEYTDEALVLLAPGSALETPSGPTPGTRCRRNGRSPRHRRRPAERTATRPRIGWLGRLLGHR